MGIVLLLIVFIWLLVATWPFHRFRKRGDDKAALRIGLPFMLVVLLAPFWDFIFMIPAIYSAYFRLETHEVYSISNARSILVRPPAEAESIAAANATYRNAYSHRLALFQGKLDFVEIFTPAVQKSEGRVANQQTRYKRMPIDSVACEERGSIKDGQFPKWCIAGEAVENSIADVIIEYGDFHVAPYSWMPGKTYHYGVWRARDAATNQMISEWVGGFMWDPAACYFANACRYVVDGDYFIKYVGIVQDAVPNAVEKYEDRR